MTLYKVLDANGKPYHGGIGIWSLPYKAKNGRWVAGEWMPPVAGNLIPCQNGYHLVTITQLVNWLGPTIWIAEGQGDHFAQDGKYVYRQARLLQGTAWDERAMRLFACDCAERVIWVFERRYPHDDRPRSAVETSRRYVLGKASKHEMRDARNKVWAAVDDFGWAAAWAAADNIGALCVIKEAASAAAIDAARVTAVWDDVAFNSERRWQAQRLKHYLLGSDIRR